MPLHIACDRTSLEIVKLLTQNSPAYVLDAAQDNGDTPLDRACRRTCPEIVHFLLSQGSSVFVDEDQKQGPLLNAVLNKVEYAISIVSMLLDAGANINHRDKFRNTALLYAAQLSALELHAEELSSVGTAFTGYLGWREKCSKIDLIMLLIERGSDVNAVGVGSRCALHWAVISTQENLVRKLIVSGCDLDKRDDHGLIPLCYACQKGSKVLVDILIISGADLRAQNWEVFVRNFEDETTNELLNYVIHESKKCLDLKYLCYRLLRKKLRHLEKDASHLGLPQFLIKCLLLK
ncbi:putative ankyrin repeat protein RF_0381 [Stegodyphus dumicola]|uniref:putative ankyrin repeat protein RF_0381 n=1 Tax=Stegodyphus dumicola TaxID=202533 RepID=UPI0015AE0B70|nr:putative ankyrin repeat protein RF_0381 [Stegodyphus dumicola]XP_035223723.1 putative ankyrin repeat protein RF_0381 [Stegodyphus dumicola]